MRKAVLDVGSNSVLLTVAELGPEGWVPVLERTAVTSLGEGTKETGLLSEAAQARTLEAIRRFWKEAEDAGAEVQAWGTMALRIARNQGEFVAASQKQGTPVGVLSWEEEADLGFRAVAADPLFLHEDRISIIDPGGQSTELVTADRAGDDWVVRFRRSYPIGTLGLRGRFGERLVFPGLLEAVTEIDDTIGLAYGPDQSGRAVVLGATGTNLVTIRERMVQWDPVRVHGARLEYEEASKAVGWLGPLSDAERADTVGLEPGRETTIHYGALILERFLFALRANECRVSVRGWRHALLERP
jgi:exopolyphosphatase/guanosine-5'-triphosphate,3'-diphosphate pyrophosphatase